MTTKQKIYKAVLLILIVVTVAFIFSNSLLDKTDSLEQSDKAKGILTPILEFFVGEGNVTSHLIRKLAHFAEFGVLGLELFFLTKTLASFQFFASLLIAVSDETIQLFSDRGSQVQDIWIDFFGACSGIVFGFAITEIIKFTINRRQKNKK